MHCVANFVRFGRRFLLTSLHEQILAEMRVQILALAAYALLATSFAEAQRCVTLPVTNGTLPTVLPVGHWDCRFESAPVFVYRYDADTYIIREDPCFQSRASFVYLLIGQQKALLLDTGFTASADAFPLQFLVETAIRAWLDERGRSRDSLELVVAHTRSDHSGTTSADAQFRSRAWTTVVGASVAEVSAFFRINDWPRDIGFFDLGGRWLSVVPVPGQGVSGQALSDPT